MKKTIIPVLIISVLLISGCSENTSETAKNKDATEPPKATVIQEISTPTPAPEETQEPAETQEPEKKPKKKKASNASINDIKKYMVKNNAVSGKYTKMAADIIGAVNGFKYSDSSVEIYEYDIKSKVYKDLVKSKKVYLDGMEDYPIDVISINGKFVLLGEPSKDAIKIFDAFK